MSQSKDLRVLPSEVQYDYVQDLKLRLTIFFPKKNATLGSPLISNEQKFIN